MPNKDKNIIDLKGAIKGRKIAMDKKAKQPPLFNIPMVTKFLVITLIAIYFVQEVSMTVTDKASFLSTFGFVPTNFSEFNGSQVMSLVSPITYMFIHGSLVHIIMNTLMLVAFGAGLEKWLGGLNLLLIFFCSGLIAIGIHFMFSMFSTDVVIGASGATSGLFAAGLIMLRNMGTGIGSGPYGLYPLIGLYVAISILFGITGSPDGGSVAWIAHIGGFFGGFAVMKLLGKL